LVLVIDDDPTSRCFMKFVLAKEGYDVIAAENAGAARQAVLNGGIGTFDCVVADYRMPEETGLEFMAWIRAKDSTLATIIVTAEGERALIAESLRGGAVDFLDKPIEPETLRAAVDGAVQRTRRERRLADSESAMTELGRTQQWLLGAGLRTDKIEKKICFYPRREAGGDFFTSFEPAPHQIFYLLTDVSGHDVQAAYVSAYFQGVVRGMLKCSTSVNEIFDGFNQLLLDEWNGGEKLEDLAGGIEASVAACGVLIDTEEQTVTVVSHGTPAPVYWSPDGKADRLGEDGGFPLGWFGKLSTRNIIQSFEPGGTFCLWTDGMEEVAKRIGVSELSLAYAIQRAKARNEKLKELEAAADDILLATLELPAAKQPEPNFRPLILERYRGNKADRIDDLQSKWKRSLKLAIPDIPESILYDALLASREAVLNGMKHGCGGRREESVSFQAAYSPAVRTARVRVSDPGPGYHFKLNYQAPANFQQIPEEHRGLVLLTQCATKLSVERNGASLTMDFVWS